eukprot:10582551-Alexandrium_andersonii.AAC.1
MIAGTLRKRVIGIRKLAKSIGRLPCGPKRRGQAVAGKMVPKAIFGCETAPVTAECRDMLVGAVKSAMHMGNQARGNGYLLMCALPSPRVDPLLQIL